MSLNYAEINARALNRLLSTKKHIASIDDSLRSIVELRVSQINGCSFCINLHSYEARKLGVTQKKLDSLPVWKESGLFSDNEMAALNWAEIVTNVATESNLEEKLNTLLRHFNEVEAVDLTFIISLMNCLNRLSISFGDKPPQ